MADEQCETTLAPNEILAVKLASSLIKEGLLDGSHSKSFLSKVSDGKASETDWHTWADKVVANKGADNGTGQN